ncbi:hypothetical protein DQ04_00311050 [Trypanosoma grayi]|uniref:hypothetical protein n=1 Tax=Trypanosoma grayi TaxID=71804 RepID=UPI0004F466FD|nr:hypothetical protein DQ04_00311050 [Trypanosoma grayi]KEG14769.1 hypothetical protein DQ04_00311050 [Trypanosoma grayi]
MGSPSKKRLRKEAQSGLSGGDREADDAGKGRTGASGACRAMGAGDEGEGEADRSQEAIECLSIGSHTSEREDELLAEGENLSGAALRAFLQQNFVDYIDRKIPHFADLEETDV